MFFFDKQGTFVVKNTLPTQRLGEFSPLLSQALAGFLGVFWAWTWFGSISAWSALAGCLAAWFPAFWTMKMYRRQRRACSDAVSANPLVLLRAVLFIRLYGFLLSILLLVLAFVYMPRWGVWSVFGGFVLTLKGYELWVMCRFLWERVTK
jgi:hypothetical protein